MKIYGIDFTSAPSGKKPITCADCTLENGFLHLNELKKMKTFDDFDDFLANACLLNEKMKLESEEEIKEKHE